MLTQNHVEQATVQFAISHWCTNFLAPFFCFLNSIQDIGFIADLVRHQACSLSQAEWQFKPCVNGDFSFLWESQKFDPSQHQTPDLIEIKFCTLDYVLCMTPHARFHVKLHKAGFSANRWNIRKKFASCTYTFFQKLTYRSDFRRIFACDGSNDVVSRKMCLLGIKKFEINI